MTNKFHQGMTRTTSPSRDKSPLRLLGLILLCASVSLTLGWALFSPFEESGGQQAQAQTTEPEPPPDGAQEEEFEEAYAAYDYKNPFDRNRVAQPKTEGAMEPVNDDTGDANANQQSQQSRSSDDEIEDMNGSPPAGNKGKLSSSDNEEDLGNEDSSTQQQNIQRSTTAGPGNTPPVNGDTATPSSRTSDVNCEGLQGLERIICEEDAPGASGGGAAQPGGTGDFEDDLDGGSGRSGASEPTETFRNGGPAPGK